MRRTFFILVLLLFAQFACNAPKKQVIKIATYNIYWLDDGITGARRNRLQEIIRDLDADVIGFQEINNRKALESILPENYRIAIMDDPEELQETALAVREPLKISAFTTVFCPGHRAE